MEVEKMVQLFNEDNKSLKDIGNIFGISKSTVQRRITSSGYVLDKKNNIYVLSKGDSELKNSSHETIENNKQSDNVLNEIVENDKMVNGSYTIPFSVARALKLKAVMEDKKVIDIVRECIEKSIEERYFNM